MTLYLGDSLTILRALPDQSVDAIITDPPYSSGGLFLGSKSKKTSAKYQITNKKIYPEFCGDNRDQRSYLAWSSMWMAECLRVTKEGGFLLCFSDWRQLPITTDALQCGGWIWRGIVPWDKTEGTRPQMGWFRAQCEYILTASRGSMGGEQERERRVCLPGIYRENVRSHAKRHMTGKPVELMESLMQVLCPNSTILDPFAGSGTTALAAKNLGHKSINIEMSTAYCDIIRERLTEEKS